MTNNIKQYFVTVNNGVWDKIRKVEECSCEQEMDNVIASWENLAYSQRASITKVFIEIKNIGNNDAKILSKLNKKILERVSFNKNELEGTVVIKEIYKK